MFLAAMLVVPRMSAPISFDGAQTYLPLAKRLLAEGAAFFRAPESISVAPVAYLYPALLGASEAAVRWGNVLLFLATIGLAYEALRVAHSRAAGVTAAFLIALSPTLRPYVADVLTEPPFLFMIALWVTAVANVQTGTARRPWAWILAGAFALSVATLTRSSVQLLAPALLLVFLLRASRARPEARPIEWRLAAMHGLAPLLPLFWIVHNQAAFGLASIATGSGAALWLGADPMTYGFDPVYFGMDYDVGAVARDVSHLSLEGDRILRGAAILELRDIPLPVLAEMFARKAAAFLTVGSVELSANLVSLRAWRVALLVPAVAAVAWQWRSRLVFVLAACVLYMVAIHLPALYHHRYSVGAIDLPLAMLASVGLAQAARSARRAGALAVTVILAVGLGLSQLGEAGPGSPRVDRAPGELLFSQDMSSLPITAVSGARTLAPGRFSVEPGATLDIPVSLKSPYAGDYTATVLGIGITSSRGHPGCDAMRLRFRYIAEALFAPNRVVRVRLAPDVGLRAVIVGTTQPLHLNADGVLRLEFECSYPATLELGRITVIAPRRAFVYHDRWLEQRNAKDPR